MRKIQLSIPEPCHEDWDNMTPTQQGRFCNACAKEVVDFSDMSDTEVLNYFLKKKDDTICGRAFPDQLDRNIAALAVKKRYWPWQYVLTAFLFFMKPAKSKAQGAVIVTDSSISINFYESVNDNRHILSAVIKDEEGNPVPYASVKIKGTSFGTSADEQGSFSIKKQPDKTMLEISALGYETKELDASDIFSDEIVLTKKKVELKEVVINSTFGITRRSCRMGGIRVKRNTVVRTLPGDTIKNRLSPIDPSIKIYPNPVARGSNFTISMKLKQAGSYTIQINDAAGRLISGKKINISTKDWNEQFDTQSSWGGGVYYVKVIDDKGKLINTSSMVVQ